MINRIGAACIVGVICVLFAVAFWTIVEQIAKNPVGAGFAFVLTFALSLYWTTAKGRRS